MPSSTAPRRWHRQQVGRGVMYGVLIVVVAAVLLLADWGKIQENFFKPEIMRDMLPEVVTVAAKNTIIYSAIAFTFGFALAVPLALMKMSSIRPYRWIANIYIEIFRGLPALVTIILVSFGLPIAFGWRIPFGTAGKAAVGLGLVAAAYMAETIRAGIQAVPAGQTEAAQALGMGQLAAMRFIVLPQALRITIPPLTNELVLLIKDTSLLFVVGTTPATKELTKFGRDFMTTTINATPLTVIALVYLIITIPLTILVRRLEKSVNEGRS
jgi:polar amino acid transport system permease protein